jgi:mRNA-degrading endonuclease RelE of RelBE toxin-antitoxin system
MKYRLSFDRRFIQQLENLPGDLRSLARRRIALLASEPCPDGAKELDGFQGVYRLWLPRSCRLVWQVIPEEQKVVLIYVGPKSAHLYEQLGVGKKHE